jgi:hypothetical protein
LLLTVDTHSGVPDEDTNILEENAICLKFGKEAGRADRQTTGQVNIFPPTQERYFFQDTDPGSIRKNREKQLEYCKPDTLSRVKSLEIIQLIKPPPRQPPVEDSRNAAISWELRTTMISPTITG